MKRELLIVNLSDLVELDTWLARNSPEWRNRLATDKVDGVRWGVNTINPQIVITFTERGFSIEGSIKA